MLILYLTTHCFCSYCTKLIFPTALSAALQLSFPWLFSFLHCLTWFFSLQECLQFLPFQLVTSSFPEASACQHIRICSAAVESGGRDGGERAAPGRQEVGEAVIREPLHGPGRQKGAAGSLLVQGGRRAETQHTVVPQPQASRCELIGCPSLLFGQLGTAENISHATRHRNVS